MAMILGGLIALATLTIAWMAMAMNMRARDGAATAIPVLLIGLPLAAGIAATHWIGW